MRNIVSKPAFLPVALMLFCMILAPATALAESGTLSDCLTGCLPDDSQCTECCQQAFDSPTLGKCYEDFTACNHVCENQEGIQAVACLKSCQRNLRGCCTECEQTSREFSCPNWVAPKECPSRCQTWSPLSRKCVGAPESLCD